VKFSHGRLEIIFSVMKMKCTEGFSTSQVVQDTTKFMCSKHVELGNK